MDEVLIALAIGFAGGFAGGLLGIGGGAIYVPAMVILLDEQQHLAQGASLTAMIATAVVGGLTHLRRGNVRPSVAAQVAPVAVVAGFAAALLASQIEAHILQRIFGAVILYFSLSMIIGALRRPAGPVMEGEGAQHGRAGESTG